MELTTSELATLLGRDGAPASPDHRPSIYDNLIGQRVLVRTRISGVSIGIARAIEVGQKISVELDDSYRVHSWGGGALAASEVARGRATKMRVERNPDGFIMADDGAELIPVTDDDWASIRSSWTEGPQ